MSTESPKLYSAYSVVNNFHDRDDVNFKWFAPKRKQPAYAYGELIEHHAQMPDNEDRQLLQQYVDELLTEKEVLELKAYLLEHHDTELFIQRVDMPITKKFRNAAPFSNRTVGGAKGYYLLAKEKTYDLPFTAWAFYDLTGCPLTIGARKQIKLREPGVRFLGHALAALQLKKMPEASQLDALVKHLYARHGFSVTQTKTETASQAAKINRPKAVSKS